MAEFRAILGQHLKAFRAAPFLFVGAGLSQRYLELDDWEALLRRLADLTGEDFDFSELALTPEIPKLLVSSPTNCGAGGRS